MAPLALVVVLDSVGLVGATLRRGALCTNRSSQRQAKGHGEKSKKNPAHNASIQRMQALYRGVVNGLLLATIPNAHAEFSSFFFSSRRRHTRLQGDWSSDVCSSDLVAETKVIGGQSRAIRVLLD